VSEKSSESSVARYELKLATGLLDVEAVRAALVAAAPALSEVFPERAVHSLYYDTRDLAAFRDHVQGIGRRSKLRARWYGGAFAGDGALERKSRDGSASLKSVQPLVLGGPRQTPLIAQLLTLPQQSVLSLAETYGPDGAALWGQTPVVWISYRRRYFAAPSGLRATLDFSLRAAAVGTLYVPGRLRALGGDVIVELKAEPHLRDRAADLMARLGWPRVRHSKYVRAVRELDLR
jgi:hypothetical protein